MTDLRLSVRSENALLNAGIKTAEEVAEMGYRRLLRVSNLGTAGAKEVWEKVQHLSKRMIRVRLRVVVYRLPEPDSYGYYVDNTTDVGPGEHAVWIEADVPAEPPSVEARLVGR